MTVNSTVNALSAPQATIEKVDEVSITMPTVERVSNISLSPFDLTRMAGSFVMGFTAGVAAHTISQLSVAASNHMNPERDFFLDANKQIPVEYFGSPLSPGEYLTGLLGAGLTGGVVNVVGSTVIRGVARALGSTVTRGIVRYCSGSTPSEEETPLIPTESLSSNEIQRKCE